MIVRHAVKRRRLADVGGAVHSVRCYETVNKQRRTWDPTKIYPHEEGQVRICGITMRDGHQSLNGGLHHIDMLEKGAALINKIRPAGMEYPGQEEIGGGTTVDFPLRFKGENPFRNMERIAAQLPNVPTSCLIRSDSLCTYSPQPRDVVRSFIQRYAECGLDIFRNFDAYNNMTNHETVAGAVIDAGKHYQAALTFTSHDDPTLFNYAAIKTLAKDLASLGAHSFCIKDMAGIAAPKQLSMWVAACKDAVPHLPVIVHSHYTTGFSPLAYMEAIRAGANGIDLGISTLSGRSGHPAMEVFTRTLSDMGYDLGFDVDEAQAAMKDVAEFYREWHPKYEFCEMKMAGTVDYRVFEKGVPGGQISIFRNELVGQGYGHLFNGVIDQIQRVRTQVGGVALVTPTSEHVARQSTANAMQGFSETTEDSKLWPGYSEMLRGVMGRPPAKPEESLQLRALRENVAVVAKLIELSDESQKVAGELAAKIVDFMWAEVRPVLEKQQLVVSKRRIGELTEVDAAGFADRIEQYKAEVADLEARVAGYAADVEEAYKNLLSREPTEKAYDRLVSEMGAQALLDTGVSKEEFLELIVAASYCTVTPSSILPDGMEQARGEVEQLAIDEDFQIPPRGSLEFEECAILWSLFKNSQNIALNYFSFGLNKTKLEHWAAPPKLDDVPQEIWADLPPEMYPFVTKNRDLASDHVMTFSDTEIKRVFKTDIEQLQETEAEVQRLEAEEPDNECRSIIRDRDLGRAEERLEQLRSKVDGRIKAALAFTKSGDAGLSTDFSTSFGYAQKQVESQT